MPARLRRLLACAVARPCPWRKRQNSRSSALDPGPTAAFACLPRPVKVFFRAFPGSAFPSVAGFAFLARTPRFLRSGPCPLSKMPSTPGSAWLLPSAHLSSAAMRSPSHLSCRALGGKTHRRRPRFCPQPLRPSSAFVCAIIQENLCTARKGFLALASGSLCGRTDPLPTGGLLIPVACVTCVWKQNKKRLGDSGALGAASSKGEASAPQCPADPPLPRLSGAPAADARGARPWRSDEAAFARDGRLMMRAAGASAG